MGENIAYGLPDENVSRDDVIAAAKAANAHDFIISLPEVCSQNLPSQVPLYLFSNVCIMLFNYRVMIHLLVKEEVY